MESDVVRDQMDDLHDMDKTLRREREAMKKKIRKVSKEQSAYRAETISKIASGSEISTRSADQLPNATSSTTNGVPLTKVVTPKAKVVVSNEDKRYAWSKANYEGRKYVGYNFKEIEGYGFQPGLVIKFIASEKFGRENEDSKFVIRYNDGTIVENVSPLELVKCGVPLKLGTFGFTTDEIYNFMIGINGDTPRGRGRPRKYAKSLPPLPKSATSNEYKKQLQKLNLELEKINEKLVECAKKKIDLPYGLDRRGNRYWHFKDTDGVGRIFIENGGTGEWRTIESKISLLKLLAFLSRRSKVECELLDILEKIKPILLSMWADKAGSDVPIVQQRKAGQSLMPPIFFPVKLCSRPYNITITNGGKIQDVERVAWVKNSEFRKMITSSPLELMG